MQLPLAGAAASAAVVPRLLSGSLFLLPFASNLRPRRSYGVRTLASQAFPWS